MLKHWLFRLHSLTAAAAVAIAAISLISFLLPEEELFSISFFVVLPDVCTEPSDVCKKRLQYVQFDCYLCAMRSIYVIAPSKSTNWTDIIFFFSVSLSELPFPGVQEENRGCQKGIPESISGVPSEFSVQGKYLVDLFESTALCCSLCTRILNLNKQMWLLTLRMIKYVRKFSSSFRKGNYPYSTSCDGNMKT